MMRAHLLLLHNAHQLGHELGPIWRSCQRTRHQLKVIAQRQSHADCAVIDGEDAGHGKVLSAQCLKLGT